MNGHSAEYSKVISKYIVMPQHSNPNGVMFGGVLMGWIDMAAAMVAEKHSGKDVVTVHVDQISFTSPILVGEHVIISAQVSGTGRSSMKITVAVESENVKTNTVKKTTTANLTFVAIDEMKRSCAVPALIET
jgi:acyl-CoA hydrolase